MKAFGLMLAFMFVHVSIQELITGFDEMFSKEEGYSSPSSGNEELTRKEQFQVNWLFLSFNLYNIIIQA